MWSGIVTKDGVAQFGYFDCKFILQTALGFEVTNNTQYLEDDCLRIRVKEVAIYSVTDIPKVPSWQDPTLSSQSVSEFTSSQSASSSITSTTAHLFHSPSWLQDAIECFYQWWCLTKRKPLSTCTQSPALDKQSEGGLPSALRLNVGGSNFFAPHAIWRMANVVTLGAGSELIPQWLGHWSGNCSQTG